MSTRTLESKKDRMIAILINPFVSCPARLAVYGVFVGGFFSDEKLGIFNLGGIIIFLLYVLGIVAAILTIVIVVWALSNLPLGVELGSKDSILGMIGSFIVPIFTWAGFGFDCNLILSFA